MASRDGFRVIGRSVPRLDGPAKVTGLTRYAGDVFPPGLLHARLVLSPHAHARIVRVHAEAARALPGVVGVFTGRDLPIAEPDPGDRNRAPLALDRALFNGHPVAAVVAESDALADDGAALVRVEYEELPAVVDPVEAMRPDAPRVGEPEAEGGTEEMGMHGGEDGGRALDEPRGPNVATTSWFARGDVRSGLGEADVVVEGRYTTSIVHQGYLEPQAAMAEVDALGHVTVWTSTQALFFARAEVAAVLGIADHRVRMVAMPIGGGFGGKYVLLEPLVAAMAWRLRRPVAVVLTRREEFLATTPAPQSRFELKLAATRDGRLTALQARVIFDAGAFPGAPLGLACLTLGGYYRIPHFDIRGWEVRTNKPGSGAYRAPGAVQATFALESSVDEIARRLGIDPLEVRLANAVGDGDPMANGTPWPPIGFRHCLARLRERRDGFLRSLPPPSDGVRRGVGIAAGGWVGGVEPAAATCRLNGDGSFSVVVGSVDLSGTNTALAQITAEILGVGADRVDVVNADSDSAPWAGASGGSKITYTVGAAVKQAAEDARRQVLAIAAEELEAAPDDLELTDGAVRVRGVPDRAVTLTTIAERSSGWDGDREPVIGHGKSAQEARAPGFAVHLAAVDVEPETGDVRPVGQLVVQDVGRALNPAAIEGQISGAVAQGVGWALTERMAYDEEGRLLSATLLDYGLPGIGRVPAVEVMLVEVPSATGPFGARGVGEPPVVGAPAAIANAVADATGTRPTALPITSSVIAAATADAS